MYKKNASINQLIRVAHEISEKYNISEIDELISLARDVRASTLNFDLPPSNILEDTASLCKVNGIKFAIIGGMALTIHGQIRDTSDINILVDLALDTAEEHFVLGIKVPVVSAESLIGLKAAAVVNNPNRKSKDYPDIMSVWVKSKPDLSKIEQFLSEEEKKVITTICSEDV